MSRIAISSPVSGGTDAADAVIQVNPITGRAIRPYDSPDGRAIVVGSTMGILFSDDFGGAAIDTTKWDVIDGGLPAVVAGSPVTSLAGSPIVSFSQAAIGTTTPGMGDSVANSALAVTMGTTNQAERWYLSRQIFAGAEDVTVIVTKSQAVVGNSIFIGLVEVDLASGIPLLNPNLANDFTNRGGVEFGKSATATAYNCEAVADSSSLVAAGTAGTAAQTFASGDEVTIEFHAEDIIASTCITDSISGKVSTPARVAKQCPNDGKAYKLLMRFKNVSGPTATTVTIDRILVVDCQEHRVEVTSGRGDQNSQKAMAVNLTGAGATSANVQGPNANNVANSNPVAIGYSALNGNQSVLTSGRIATAIADLAGRPIVKPIGFAVSHDFGKIVLSTTGETTLLTQQASLRHEIQQMTFANLDTVKHIFDVRDTTAGSVRHTVSVLAGDSRDITFPGGLPAAAVNTNFTVTMREAVTTTAPEISSSSYKTPA